MTPEEMQKFGKESMETAMASFGVWTKGAQAIAAEVADYSKKSIEDSAAAWERLWAPKAWRTAMQVQSEYLKSSYEEFRRRSDQTRRALCRFRQGSLQAV